LWWESFGLGLSVRPKTLLHRGDVTLADDSFTRRFAVDGRERSQIEAALSREVRAAMLALGDDVVLDDEGALVRSHASPRDAAELRQFVDALLTFARALEAAEQQIPPPYTMRSAAAAWRAFAERHGGRLHLGRLALRRATIDGTRVDLETPLGKTGQPARTRVTVTLEEPVGQPFDSAKNENAALRELAGSVIEATRAGVARTRAKPKAGTPAREPPKVRILAGGTTMTLSIACALRDPEILREPIGGLLALAQRLGSDDVRRGPYR
jgi:hypothetical protein